MSKLALRAQAADIANLPLRQGLLAKKRFNDRSKEFLFAQQPVRHLTPETLYCSFFMLGYALVLGGL
ncbi:MAG: hypothetical protein DRH43_06245 [Deltaproteobacteria bacterium]|nr:MAG: hypothetical protein DRH43_06245 [Deltaproteobacteria bacterium]